MRDFCENERPPPPSFSLPKEWGQKTEEVKQMLMKRTNPRTPELHRSEGRFTGDLLTSI